MARLYYEIHGEIILLILLGGLLISIPLYLNILGISLHVIGPDWDNELWVYGISMQPTLEDGDSVCTDIIDPSLIEANSRNGDIIVFDRPHGTIAISPTVVVHRAINKTVRNELVYFQTKGDRNSAPDYWNDARGEEYTLNGMISQKLLIGKVVGVRKTHALNYSVIVMAVILTSITIIDFVGYVSLTKKKPKTVSDQL
jgi:signal peptidase I